MHSKPDLHRDFRAALLEDENTRRLLKIFIALALGGGIVYLATANILAKDGALRSAGVIAAFCSTLGALALLRRNRIDLAAQVLVWGIWLSILLQIFISNGLLSRSLMAVPIVIVLAGWLLPVRNAVALCIATILCGLALAFAERAGLLPLFISPSPPLLVWLAFTIYIILAATVAYHIFRGFRLRHEALRRIGIELSEQVDTLAAREAELHLLMESVPVMIFHGDRDRRCIFANRSYAGFYGPAGNSLIGMTVREIVGEEAYRGVDARIDRVLAGERLAYRGARKSPRGDEAILDIELLPEPDGKGGTRGFFAVINNVTAQVQAEAELRRSEEKFAKVFRFSPLAVAITRLEDGLYLDVNESWSRLFGWGREEAVGRTSMEMGKWLDLEERAAWAAALKRGGHVANMEVRFRTKAGAVRHVLLSAELIDLGGEACALVMVADISDRKAVEQALHESEERLRLAASGGGVGIWEWNTATNDLLWNGQLKAIFGLPAGADHLTLDQFVGAIHPDDLARTQKAYLSALEGHGEFDCEYRIVRPDGDVRWIVARGHGQYDAAGKPTRMLGMAIDITERRRAEEKFAKVFQASPVAISISRLRDGFYLDVNDAFVEHFGWAREEFIGHTAVGIGLWPSKVDRDKWAAELRLAGRVRNSETRLNTKSGEQRNVLVSAEKIILDGEECIIGLVHDITEQMQAKTEIQRLNDELETRVRERTAELQAANKELESFAYSISHDLRAPLRGIDGFSHMLAEEYADRLDAQGRGYLDRVRRAAQRMGTLIDDILELSRVTRLDMRRTSVDLNAQAREILDERTRAAPEHAVQIVLAADCKAYGDPQLLRVMMQNLLENAWKYSAKEPAPRIEFGCGMENGERVFHVRDNGVGFDMQYADRLFAPFQRLHKPEEFEGTGIGLATVARVVHRHGGRVWAESAVGEGATFRFTLGHPSGNGQ